MKVNTYGIYGLTEWQGKLKAGNIEVNVSFAGGTASSTGAQPAYFVTKNPITQFVIENSKEFKSGFIHLEMSQEIEGVHPSVAMPKATPAKEQAAAEPENDSNAVHADGIIKVADKSEAIEWLKEHFPNEGYTSVKLRSMSAVNEAAKKHGVVFDIASE